MNKYLTIYNVVTKKSVPFLIMPNGEIKINSSNILDDEDNCIVSLTKKFFEHSQDFRKRNKRI